MSDSKSLSEVEVVRILGALKTKHRLFESLKICHGESENIAL